MKSISHNYHHCFTCGYRWETCCRTDSTKMSPKMLRMAFRTTLLGVIQWTSWFFDQSAFSFMNQYSYSIGNGLNNPNPFHSLHLPIHHRLRSFPELLSWPLSGFRATLYVASRGTDLRKIQQCNWSWGYPMIVGPTWSEDLRGNFH